ncbi:MAG TPA: alpha/beta hydrolase [Actinocatenispora sp.]
MAVERERVRFASADTDCVAWHYPGSNGACVVMAGAFAMTREPATDRFAARFQDDGFGVLAFDYRRLGESGGHPRQVVRVGDQLADWRAAIGTARSLPGVDRVAIWGLSVSGGHVMRVAARDPRVAAAIAHSPFVDGRDAVRNAVRHQTPRGLAGLAALGVLDALGGLVGRRPLLVPTAGEPGAVALATTPDADGSAALDPDGRYDGWARTVAARSALRLGCYRPGRSARRVRCPLLVLVCDGDTSDRPGPAIRAAAEAPRGELVRVPGDHHATYRGAHELAVAAEVSFLRRHLLAAPADGTVAAAG